MVNKFSDDELDKFLAPPPKAKLYISPEARAEGIGPQPDPSKRFGGGARMCGDHPIPKRKPQGLAWWQQVDSPTKMV